MTVAAQAIQRAVAGRTVIVITHDPGYFESDFNVLLHGGTVHSQGTHRELLAACPEYLALFGPECGN